MSGTGPRVGELGFGINEALPVTAVRREARRGAPLSKDPAAGLSAGEKEIARLAEKQIADMGAMGLHRLLNDQPRAALALFEVAAKSDPRAYAGRIASLRKRLGTLSIPRLLSYVAD